jgi:hypothetical protein
MSSNNFDQKGNLSSSKNPKKYGWKEIEIRDNSSYRNFSRFKKEFELKFRELL